MHAYLLFFFHDDNEFVMAILTYDKSELTNNLLFWANFCSSFKCMNKDENLF